MNKTILTFVISILIAITTQPSFAQGFSAIFEKLDTLEKRLNSLESTQKKEIRTLENKIQKSPMPQENPEIKKQVSKLETDIQSLSENLKQVEQTAQSAQQSPVTNDLVSDLRGLINEMRTTISHPIQQPKETPTPEGLQISGFGDIYGTVQQGGNYQVGQAEVDLSAQVNEKIGIEAAIAYNGEGFELGAFFAEFKLWGNTSDHYWYMPKVQSASLTIGQFDVPFGIDCRVYPSIDRKLVSAPLAVAETHGCWNDTGLQFQIQSQHIGIQTFLVNGFGEEESKLSLGGRLGFMPHTLFEIGTSWAGFLNNQNQWDMVLAAGDIQMGMGALDIKGEYLYRKTGLNSEQTQTQHGFYGQGQLSINRLFLVGRYGRIHLSDPSTSYRSRLSLGAGWVVQENCELRTEYQKNFQEEDVTFVQAVVGF